MSCSNYVYPCKGCEKRFLGCHDSCIEYNKVKVENEKKKAYIEKIKKEEQRLTSFKIDGCMKVRRAR